MFCCAFVININFVLSTFNDKPHSLLTFVTLLTRLCTSCKFSAIMIVSSVSRRLLIGKPFILRSLRKVSQYTFCKLVNISTKALTLVFTLLT